MKQHIFFRKYTAIASLLFFVSASAAQTLTGSELVTALQQGGLVLVMRHTSSPRELPDAATANPDNLNNERQLDETGRRDAALMGEALRRLQVPIGELLSSPTYRALETARLAGFADVAVKEELSNEGMRESSAQYAEWLQSQVAYQPDKGNRVLITHGPNISAAFTDAATGMEEGDMLVFDPDTNSEPRVVARITTTDWAAL